MSAHPRLRSDLIYATSESDGTVYITVKDPVSGSFFRMREPEHWLIQQMNGQASPALLAERFGEKFGAALSTETISSFVEVLDEHYFLEGARVEQIRTRKGSAHYNREGFFSRLLSLRLAYFNPTRLLDRLVGLYRPLHNWWGFLISVFVIVSGLSLLTANSAVFYIDLADIFTLGSFATVVIGLFVLLTIHEFAHAVVCRFYGGEVREVGFLLLYFQPCFYADVSDAWLFPKKSQRLAVTWAGPYAQLILLSVAVIGWRVTVPGMAVNDLFRIITVVAWITLLFNFNPLIRLDGYYLLSDLVAIPNLRDKSFAYLNYLFTHYILGWASSPPEINARERKICLVYAVSAGAFSIFLIVYFLFVVAQFLIYSYGQAGILLVAFLLGLILWTPSRMFARGVIKQITFMKSGLMTKQRLIAWGVILVVVVIVFGIIPFDHKVSGEVAVRPRAEYSLLINEFGLLESRLEMRGASPETKSDFLQMTSNEMAKLELVPYVRDGQLVALGDTLAKLISNQVIKELVAGRSELERLEGQLNLIKSPPKPEAVREADAEVTSAQAVVSQSERELERVRGLSERGLVPSNQLETAQRNYDVAIATVANKKSRLQLIKSPPKKEEVTVIQAEIDKQKARLHFLDVQERAQSIIAPFAGEVVSSIADGRILTVMANDKIELLVPISDFDIKQIVVGQEVRAKLRSFPDSLFAGAVVRVPTTAEESNSSSLFLVSVLIDNPNNLLRRGMTGYAKIHVGEQSLITQWLNKLGSTVRVEFWSWW
jgi:putative peptide zinc metalloprotease protein